jgi:hypothetical protein
MSEGKRGPLTRIEKVNYIIDFIDNPCDAPYIVYIETLLPAALEAFASLEAYDYKQVIRNFSRPRGLRSGRHGRRGRRSGKRGFGIPDINDEIADFFKENADFTPRKISNGVRHLYTFLDLLEKGLFLIMFADLATDFAYRFTSLVHRTEYCTGKHRAAGNWTKDIATAIPLISWQGPGIGTVGYQHPPYLEVSVGGAMISEYDMDVILAGHAVNLNLGPNLIGLGLWLGIPTDPPPFTDIAAFIGPGEAGLVVRAHVPAGVTVQPAIFAANLLNNITGLIMFALAP